MLKKYTLTMIVEDDADYNPYCDIWNGTFTAMFHSASLVFGTAFSIPQCFEFSFLLTRSLITLGLVLMVLWSVETVCRAPDLFMWNVCFTLINSLYLVHLIKKHFPTFLPTHMVDYYECVFRPLHIEKRDFKLLTRDAKIEHFRMGQYFCQEHRSSVEKKLHVLLSGMMTVRCDGVFLQAIQPNEFIDSVEWKSGQHGQAFPTHQVTVETVADCEVLVFDEETLERVFDDAPKMRFVVDCLVAKDISKKLYAVSDIANMGAHQDNQSQNVTGKTLRVLDFRRTVSMDAIHTGGKGHVRSHQWLKEANLRSFHNDEQVALVNFELDVPPTMEYLPHRIPVQILDKETMAEAQFLAQQRKYWPSGFI